MMASEPADRAKKNVSVNLTPELYERMLTLLEERPGKINRSHFVRQSVRERVERLEDGGGPEQEYQDPGWLNGESPIATTSVSSGLPRELYDRVVALLNQYRGTPDMAPFVRKAIRERVVRLENREAIEVPPPGEFGSR